MNRNEINELIARYEQVARSRAATGYRAMAQYYTAMANNLRKELATLSH